MANLKKYFFKSWFITIVAIVCSVSFYSTIALILNLNMTSGLMFSTIIPAIITYPIANIIIKNNKQINKQKEVLLLQAQKLQLANQTKDKFFSIIAHDLKGPLGVLLGFSKLLSDYHDTYTKEEIVEIINSIHTSTTQTYHLLENLLTWALSQEDRLSYMPTTIDITKMIGTNIDLLKEQARKKENSLFFSNNMELQVLADKNMLDTIIRNLITNALKFTSAGSINIRIKKISEHCEVSIEDTGIGMDEEKIKHLFLLGKDISATGTAGERGTGLGLILCKEFVEKNKGKLTVVSKLNQGTKFSFTIPLVPA